MNSAYIITIVAVVVCVTYPRYFQLYSRETYLIIVIVATCVTLPTVIKVPVASVGKCQGIQHSRFTRNITRQPRNLSNYVSQTKTSTSGIVRVTKQSSKSQQQNIYDGIERSNSQT